MRIRPNNALHCASIVNGSRLAGQGKRPGCCLRWQGTVQDVGSPRRLMLLAVKLTNMVLSVELQSELGDEIELRFEEIDVFLLVVHQLLE